MSAIELLGSSGLQSTAGTWRVRAVLWYCIQKCDSESRLDTNQAKLSVVCC
jgi:hypothetical protein